MRTARARYLEQLRQLIRSGCDGSQGEYDGYVPDVLRAMGCRYIPTINGAGFTWALATPKSAKIEVDPLQARMAALTFDEPAD